MKTLNHIPNAGEWIIVTALLTFLLSFLGFARYRQIRRINQLLKEELTKVKVIRNGLEKSNNELLTENDKLISLNEWLLNEVQHRVKNNLQIIIALLESQIAFLENEALKAVEQGHHRIYVIALIYQKTYLSENIQLVDIYSLTTEIFSYIQEVYADTCQKVEFTFEIDQFQLNISQAIPLALIINETVSDALQHAFTKQKTGRINISLDQFDHHVRLSITDNGKQALHENKVGGHETLGCTLVRGLVADLNGQLNIKKTEGTSIVIDFDSNFDNISGDNFYL